MPRRKSCAEMPPFFSNWQAVCVFTHHSLLCVFLIKKPKPKNQKPNLLVKKIIAKQRRVYYPLLAGTSGLFRQHARALPSLACLRWLVCVRWSSCLFTRWLVFLSRMAVRSVSSKDRLEKEPVLPTTMMCHVFWTWWMKLLANAGECVNMQETWHAHTYMALCRVLPQQDRKVDGWMINNETLPKLKSWVCLFVCFLFLVSCIFIFCLSRRDWRFRFRWFFYLKFKQCWMCEPTSSKLFFF